MTDDPTRIRVGDRVSLKTGNKKVAVERALKLAADLAHGGYRPPPPPVTVRAAIDAYLAALAADDRARRTIVKYTGVLNRFEQYLAGHRATRLGQVTVGHFDRYRSDRRAARHRKTVWCEGIVIKQLFKWARTRKLIADNPLADVRLDKPPLEPKEGPSLAQVDAIPSAADEPLRSQLAVLAFTGMRAGELQRLRPEDVDLAGGWVHVRSRPGAETKSRESRKVPVHPRLQAVLERLPATRRPWLFTAGPSKKYPAGDHHINVKRLNEQFTRLVGRLGLPVGREAGFVVHSLRHFFETFTVNAGVPQRVIDAWLGHRSDKSMAAVYYRLRDEDSQAFMTKVPFGTGGPAADAGMEEVG